MPFLVVFSPSMIWETPIKGVCLLSRVYVRIWTVTCYPCAHTTAREQNSMPKPLSSSSTDDASGHPLGSVWQHGK